MLYLFREQTQAPAPTQKELRATRVLPETQWASEPMPSGIPPLNAVVVTISRQFGSGGAEIGRLVARESGLQYVDHEIIDEVSRRLGVETQDAALQDEQTVGMAGHILEAIQSSNPFSVHYNTLKRPTATLTQSTEQAYLHLTQRFILEVATQGNAVIVGRGSQFLLHNVPRTLHIYIFAPLAYRIENVMKEFRLDHTHAARLIERKDYEHERYLRRYYGTDGSQPALYHLLINTGLFSFELAANLIYESLSVAKKIS